MAIVAATIWMAVATATVATLPKSIPYYATSIAVTVALADAAFFNCPKKSLSRKLIIELSTATNWQAGELAFPNCNFYFYMNKKNECFFFGFN